MTGRYRWRLAAVMALLVHVEAADAQAVVIPYQSQNGASTNGCAANQCKIAFQQVPPGKRLVLASVSAQLGGLSGPITLEGGSVTYFVQKPFAEAQYLTVPITLYYGPGSTPTARIFVPPGTAATSFFVTLVGTLVPAQ